MASAPASANASAAAPVAMLPPMALSARLARQQVIQDLERDQLKVQALMERFNSLMKEGRYVEAMNVLIQGEE